MMQANRMGGSANGVIPADFTPAPRIAHIINGVNIRKNLIFIVVSLMFFAALK